MRLFIFVDKLGDREPRPRRASDVNDLGGQGRTVWSRVVMVVVVRKKKNDVIT